MKSCLVFFGFLITCFLILCCYSNLKTQIALHDKIMYESMMCLQDKSCTLTLDEDI